MYQSFLRDWAQLGNVLNIYLIESLLSNYVHFFTVKGAKI